MGHGIHHGIIRSTRHGLIHNISEYDSFTGHIGLIGDSNSVGAANYAAGTSSDTSYGVSDSVGYAPVLMRSIYATGVTDPLVLLDTTTETLRAYAAPPASNVGVEQTLGRRLYQRGISVAPIISKWAVTGSLQHTNWRADSTNPATGGNMVAQASAFFLAREAEFKRRIDCIVVNLGENDTGSSTNANPTQTDIASMVAGIRSAMGRPNLPIFYFLLNSSTSGAFTATVRAGQVAWVAADQFARGIYTDDVRLASNPHYGANGYYNLGDRAAHAVAQFFFPGRTFNLGSGPAPWLQDYGSGFTMAASPATGQPCSGPDEQDGDLQLLVVRSTSTATTYSLTTPAGFTALGSGQFESVFSTNHCTMAVYQRLVSQATLDANGGRMPVPVVDGGSATSHVARILTIRGPNKWTVSPVDLFGTGVNNANNTTCAVSSPGSTAVDNELVLVLGTTQGSSTTMSNCVNTALSDITKRWDATYAASAFFGLSLYTATKATAGALGTTTLTTSAAGNNAGVVITIKP